MTAIVYLTCEMACFRVTGCLQNRESIETIAEQDTNVEWICFPDALFVIFHTQMALVSIYCKFNSAVENRIVLDKSQRITL
jgi:hypothetical protein